MVAEREYQKMRKVSVVVPCYNAAKYLDKCITQLLHQTIGINNLEIILVDDASKDDGETKKIIQKYEHIFPETIKAVFLDNNRKQGGARNVGITYAEGEYLIFCDADDWLLEETMAHAYSAAKEHDADIVSFSRRYVSTREDVVKAETGSGGRLFELDTLEKRKAYLLNMEEEDYSSQNKLFRRSLIQENHITFAEHLCMEEASFTVPARLYAKKGFYLDEKLYICYLSPESTMRNDRFSDKKWDNLQVWISIMEELRVRGVFQKYYEETEYLFFTQGIGWGISFIFHKGGFLTKNEWKMIADIVQKITPNVRENAYIVNDKHAFYRAWNDLLLTILDAEFTDENVETANQAVKRCVQIMYG